MGLIDDTFSPAVGTNIAFPAPLNDALYVKVVVARCFEVGLVEQANAAGLLSGLLDQTLLPFSLFILLLDWIFGWGITRYIGG